MFLPVQVLNSTFDEVERVHPAIARHAIAQGAAMPLDTTPFSIQLVEGLSRCPRLTKVGIKGTMSNIQNEFNKQLNEADLYTQVVEYFKRVESGDQLVWVKAVAPGGMQVAIDIRGPDGKTAYKIPTVKPGNPVCLSRYGVPFEVLKNSLSREATAQPPTLRLMTTEEVRTLYQKRAAILKTDVASLMKKDAAAHTIPRQTLASEVDVSMRLDESRERALAARVVLTPHVEHLLGQVAPRLSDDERMSVQDFMRELLVLEEVLTIDDLDAIKSQGYYPTATEWAKDLYFERARAEGLIPTSDALSD